MKSFKERLDAQRTEKRDLRKRVLPPVAYYGREPAFEQKRIEFYSAMAAAFGWKEWRLNPEIVMVTSAGGRDGRKAELASIGRERAVPIITNTAPLEYMFSKGMLHGKDDAPGASHRRLNAGQRLRSIWEGAQISGLKAANLEGSSGGGMPGRLPGEYKMDCIRWLAELRGANETVGLVQAPFSIIEDLVYHDKWVWEKVRVDRRERFILKIHRALDELSVRFHMMTMRDFNARWYPLQRRAEEQESPDPSPAQPSDQPAPRSPDDAPPSE
jgi:hypothetical protein